MSDLTDWTQHGIWVLQHHDPSFTVAGRRRLSAARLLPAEGDNPFVITGTQGDIQGALLWLEAPALRGFLHSWWFTGPGVVAINGAGGSGAAGSGSRPGNRAPSGGAGMNLWEPIRRAGGFPDMRYTPKALVLPAQFRGVLPKGWTGTASAGSDETSQQETVHPDWLNILLAVNKAGDPKAGTAVSDLNADGSPGRWAHLQSIFSVQEIAGARVIGIQNGKGGRLDGKDGYLLFVDHDTKAVGWGSQHRGGPFMVPKSCPHTHGDKADADGNRVTVVHLWTGTNFFQTPARDGPLLFTGLDYEPEELASGHRVRVDCVFDPARGVWRWQGYTPWYDPPPFDPPPPDPPPLHKPDPHERFPKPVDPPPVEKPDPWDDPPPGYETGGTPTGDPPLTTGGGGLPGGGGETANGTGNGQPLDDSDLGGNSDDILDETSDPSDPDDILDETGFGAGTGVNFIGEDGDRPVTPTSSNCVQLPNVIFKATATSVGQASLEGAVPGSANAATQKAFNDSPQVGHLHGWAQGTGQWDGFANYAHNGAKGFAKAAGGIAALPPDVALWQVLAGIAETASPLLFALAPGLAKLAFGTPSIATGGVVSGVVVEGTAAGELIASVVDSTGTVTSTTDLMAGGGGSPNPLWGDASLGDETITTGTNVDDDGLLQYTTLTLEGTSTLYATAGQELRVVGTGLLTLESTSRLGAPGRGSATGGSGGAGSDGNADFAPVSTDGNVGTAGSASVWGSATATGGGGGGGSGGGTDGTSGAGGAGGAGVNRSTPPDGSGSGAGGGGGASAVGTAGNVGSAGTATTAVSAALRQQLEAGDLSGAWAQFLGGGAAGSGGGGGSGGAAGSPGADGGAGAGGSGNSQTGSGAGVGGTGAAGTTPSWASGGGGGGAGGAGGGKAWVAFAGGVALAAGAAISCDGGAGGTGGATAAGEASGGGGGGGSGGGGGMVVVISGDASANTNFDASHIHASGGAGGAGGVAATAATFSDGGDGGAGAAGETGYAAFRSAA